MATKYQMQAQDASTLELVTWLSNAPDWAAVDAPAGGYLEDSITLTGGGIDTGTGSSVPDGAMTFDDGSYVVFDDGSYVLDA